MNRDEAGERLCSTAVLLLHEGIIQKDGCLSMRMEETVIITPRDSDLSNLTSDSLVEVNLQDRRENRGVNNRAPHRNLPGHLAIYRARKDLNALIHSTSPSTQTLSRAGRIVRPLLDDMAQIVGTSIRTAGEPLDRREQGKLVKALGRRNAVFIRNMGAICGSGTLDDAHAVCQVTEKACKAVIESSILGGGHRINRMESLLMRVIYQKKYSREAVRNK